jgi:hypothetical protein
MLTTMSDLGTSVGEESGFVIKPWGRVLIVWHHDGSANDVVWGMVPALSALQRASPQGMGCLLLLTNISARPPDGEARQQLSSLFRQHRDVLTTAVVMEGKGFWAATARSVLTFAGLASGARLKVYSTVDEAVHALKPALDATGGTPLDVEALLRRVQQIRAGR